jgi:hypothetical protein
MSKITEKNVFKNPKYVNILGVIDAYGGSLEFKHLAYILIGKKILRRMGYISSKTAEEIPRYLDKHKVKDYKLVQLTKVDSIKNPERLSECLSRLIGLGLIEKVGRIYRVNLYAKYLCWIIGDIAILEDMIRALKLGKYGKGHSPFSYMAPRLHIFSKDSGINGFLEGKYKDRFDRIVKDLNVILLELDGLRHEILTYELKGFTGVEYIEHYDWFIHHLFGMESNISVIMHTFDGITKVYSPVS